MPNLEHDVQNPSDLLGQPITTGDIVAWGTTYGRSAALAICEISKIRFIRPSRSGNGNQEVPQDQAEDYTLLLRPLKSTGSVTDYSLEHDPATNEWVRVPYSPDGARPKSVQLVKNIVKLALTRAEVDALIANG